MPSELPVILKSIQKKLVLLSDKQRSLEENNKQLLTKVNALEFRNGELVKMMENKEESFKTLKLAKKMAGDTTDTQGVKRQINDLVKEIDKCVALLNK
jgi:Fic family protein